MRTGAAAGHRGYFHEALYYDSGEQLLAVAVPFLLGGLAAGEPTLIALGERNAALVRAALPGGAAVTFLTGSEMYARPASAIQAYRQLLATHVAAGAGQVRILGELAPTAFGNAWDGWARYESAVNHAYDEFPLWSICAYDARSTPAPVLAEVARTHPRTALPHDRHPVNELYTEPETFLREERPIVPDPLQQREPVADLVAPSPAEARRAVAAAGLGHLSTEDVDGLLIAVSEMVTNAHQHGLPPVRMRVWTGAGRAVVTVDDGGAGPKNAYAGLLPDSRETVGGLGLWITHQSCSNVALQRHAGGFTVRLTAGLPDAGL